MMMGHYSGAFLAKRIAPGLPLWAAFVGAQLVDIAFMLLVVGGIERVSFDPSLASNELVLEHMPYTHSLLATALWAAAAFFVARQSFAKEAATGRAIAGALALAVMSHWFADVLVHRPDMSVFGGAVFGKFGLALWDIPLLALAVELGLLVGTALWCCMPGGPLHAARGRVAALVAGMTFVQLAAIFRLMPPFANTTELAVGGLGVFLGLPVLAHWASRAAESNAASSAQPQPR